MNKMKHRIDTSTASNTNDFETKAYKRSRGAYMAQCTFEYFVTLLVTDAFLAKLLTHIGISDHLIGIIASFVSMTYVIQLVTIFLVKTKWSTKTLHNYPYR